MRDPRAARLAALLALVSWIAPVAATLSVGLHLALHHDHPGEHTAELALAAVHGHAHELAEAEHEHEARLAGAPPGPLPPGPGVIAAGPEAVPLRSQATAAPSASAARPPPPELFTTHCAWLL